MIQIHQKSFDGRDIPAGKNVIITSPPYNMNLRIRQGKYCSRQIVRELSTKYEQFDDNLPIEEFYQLHKGYITEFLKHCDRMFYVIQIVTGSKRAFFKLMGDFADQLKEVIVWDKGTAEPAMGKGILNSQCELILVFDTKNAISRSYEDAGFDRGTLSNVWKIRKERSTHANNRAVFPQELVGRIIDNFCVGVDTIIDPFVGTGNAGVVAVSKGYNFIGFDIDPALCQHARHRLDEAQAKYEEDCKTCQKSS